MGYTYLILLFLLGAIWGASFLFIKIGVSEMGPMTFAASRVFIGSCILILVTRVRGQRLPKEWTLWRRYAFMGVFNALIPFGAIAWGTQFIPSGLSAILNATQPLFTLVLAVLVGDERVSLRRILGLLLGFAGIMVLTLPALAGGASGSFLGQLAVIVGALSYAAASVFARKHLKGQPPITTTIGQLSTGFLFLLPFSLLERPWGFSPSAKALGALLTLASLGTAFAYLLYYELIHRAGATATSLVTYISPVFGIFWGWAILSERLSWNAFAALVFILASVLFVKQRPVAKPTVPSKTELVSVVEE